MIIKKVDIKNRSKVKKLYRAAFPRAERKPFFLMERKQKEGIMEILSIEEEEFLGLVITILQGDLVLVDYFAITGENRGRGTGSRALALIRERYRGKRIFLEIESPDVSAKNFGERVRRKDFYHRNGFQDAGIYVKLFGIDMELLVDNCQLDFGEYYGVYLESMGRNISRMIKERV